MNEDQSTSRDDGNSAVANAAERELRPTLERATETLRSALGEACKTNMDRVDTGELIRVEEVLAIANEAAKEAIAVRRRLRHDRTRKQSRVSPPATSTGPLDATAHEASRTIVDSTGRPWRVFAVRPSTERGRFVVRRGFADGWLCFDAGSETRRLAPVPERWQELADDALLQLWSAAEVSHPRRRSSDVQKPGVPGPDSDEPSDDGDS